MALAGQNLYKSLIYKSRSIFVYIRVLFQSLQCAKGCSKYTINKRKNTTYYSHKLLIGFFKNLQRNIAH